MNVLELFSLAERYHRLVNPISPEKVLEIGEVAGMSEGTSVIEFGSSRAEVLALWAKHLGIRGTGIEVRKDSNDHGIRRIEELGLADRVDLINEDGSQYSFEEGSYDMAAAIGSTFIWGGFASALDALKKAVKPGGYILIGEPYWIHDNVQPESVMGSHRDHEFHTERGLLDIVRNSGHTIKYLVRSSHDDWDCYQGNNWRSLIEWLSENPSHPERSEVIDFLLKMQDDYLSHGREHIGWAIYLITPV